MLGHRCRHDRDRDGVLMPCPVITIDADDATVEIVAPTATLTVTDAAATVTINAPTAIVTLAKDC